MARTKEELTIRKYHKPRQTMRLMFKTLAKAAIGCTTSAVTISSIKLSDHPSRWCAFSDADAAAKGPNEEEEFQPRYPLVQEKDETEQEKQYWKDKRHCSFCSIFLDSPCRQQFKSWSICVDRCKSEADATKAAKKEEGTDGEKTESIEEQEGCDFASHCADSTMALFTCQGANEEYFEPFMKAEEELKKKREKEGEEEGEEKVEKGKDTLSIEDSTNEVNIVEKVGDDGSLQVEINVPVENGEEKEEEEKTKPVDTTSDYVVTSIDAMPEMNPEKE